MTLAELADALGVAPRQIRFLIAEGILPAAQKTGRSADAYGDEHLARAQRYLALHRMGMKPGSIKVLMAFDDAVPIFQDMGVELRVGSAFDPSAVNLEALTTRITEALRLYAGKE
jgi:DNA-binding transcriptional MerR regulator